jgi:hypothetical protein
VLYFGYAMPDLLTPDELVAFLVEYSDRHHASAGDTVQFMLDVAEELSKTEPERLATAARSLLVMLTIRTDSAHFEPDVDPWRDHSSISSGRGTGKTAIFVSVLKQAMKFSEMRREGASVARLRGYGVGRGLITTAPDFDDPLPADIQDAFEA